MDFKEFEVFFEKELKKNNLNVKKESYIKFYNYMKKVLDWNTKINVTAVRDEESFIIKHFIDSLMINKYIEGKLKVIDIGTGAGFPGIPIKLYNEDLQITLIDSINKKLNVIRDSIIGLDLNNIDVIHSRAEDLAVKAEYREMFDVSTTRAVSNLSTILEYMMPFIKVGGRAVCMKGPNYQEELENARTAIKLLGGQVEVIENFNINTEYERNIIVIKKIKETPKKFPRSGNKPLKEPIH